MNLRKMILARVFIGTHLLLSAQTVGGVKTVGTLRDGYEDIGCLISIGEEIEVYEKQSV